MGLKSSLGNAHGATMQEATNCAYDSMWCVKKIKKILKFYFIFKLKYQALCVNSNYQKARDPALPCLIGHYYRIMVLYIQCSSNK